MDILKLLARFNVNVILCLAGLVAVYIAYFMDFPNSANGYMPSLRPAPDRGLLIAGGVLILVCAALTILEIRSGVSGRASRSSNPRHETGTQWLGDPDKHPLVVKWGKLSVTQREITAFLYEESHREKISLDDFYKAFCRKNGPDVLGNIDELYFRLKSLETSGFLHIEPIGPKVTNVLKRQEAKLALRNGDILKTGG